MKNRLLYLFLACFFWIGATAFTQSSSLDRGIELPIIVGKSANIVCTITIPIKYIDKNNNLTIPLQISIHQGNKTPLEMIHTDGKQVVLPSSLQGCQVMTATIGDFSSTRNFCL